MENEIILLLKRKNFIKFVYILIYQISDAQTTHKKANSINLSNQFMH